MISGECCWMGIPGILSGPVYTPWVGASFKAAFALTGRSAVGDFSSFIRLLVAFDDLTNPTNPSAGPAVARSHGGPRHSPGATSRGFFWDRARESYSKAIACNMYSSLE